MAQAAIVVAAQQPKGVVLEFRSDPGYVLSLKSLENARAGIELRNVRVDGEGVMRATVFVPRDKLGHFVGRIEAYASMNTLKGSPKHNELVASIHEIRLAVMESFWTDSAPFPTNRDDTQWWEIWLRDEGLSRDVMEDFRQRAAAAHVLVSGRQLRFPDRRVTLACGSLGALLSIQNLFDLLAELRMARILAGEFLALDPRDQREFVSELAARITPPSADAPAVCHLDTGVNRGHPLLEFALAEEHLLAVNPAWPASDGNRHQHGTAMAGLALYGCLTEALSNSDPIVLEHRLESVKLIRDVSPHDPELYGEVTQQAVSRIEIAAPERQQRAFALTVTVNHERDKGCPSSWSSALDQTCAGAEAVNQPARLMIVSAGNTPEDGRHDYPNHCHTRGAQDPAQAWNAVTVGAYTEKVVLPDAEFKDWRPVAPAGQLSPSSRTSMIWDDQSWPLKPDIVMEGGNQAINPATREAEDVDDLQLLTTRLDPSGRLLTTTGDTSAATALAARYAALIWARYPNLWPETVRGLLVHSARWTPEMLREFPHDKRRNRLRVYGYGAPSLDRALASLGNCATQIIEDVLQPFRQGDDRSIKTAEMRLHRLPWPTDVLQAAGGIAVRLRVTLSYFIEPSPGERGWKYSHRYQSHGLRFQVKRPTEDEAALLKRINAAVRGEDERGSKAPNDDREWAIGPKLRNKGSIHSDVWTGTGAQLAAAGMIAVYPVAGWWKGRLHLEGWKRSARYSLIVSLETDRALLDLYTPIATQIAVTAATPISIS